MITVAGPKSNWLKVASLRQAVEDHNRGCPRRDLIAHQLVQTGPPANPLGSEGLPEWLARHDTDQCLGIDSADDCEQIGGALPALEKLFVMEQPEWVVLAGDENASLAAAIAAKKLGQRCVQTEAGLRSFDWTMTEEINRVLIDRIADRLFAPSEQACANLLEEGVSESRIEQVGDLAIDTLEDRKEAMNGLTPAAVFSRFPDLDGRQPPDDFALLTLQRSSNVDQPESLHHSVTAIRNVAKRIAVFFPVHPRTMERLREFHLLSFLTKATDVHLLGMLNHLEMLCLASRARVILTDSGGLQQEAMVLGTPCLTLRTSTERPETLTEFGGTNTLVGNNAAILENALIQALQQPRKPYRPPLWDGRSAQRIVASLLKHRDDPPLHTSQPELTFR